MHAQICLGQYWGNYIDLHCFLEIYPNYTHYLLKPKLKLNLPQLLTEVFLGCLLSSGWGLQLKISHVG